MKRFDAYHWCGRCGGCGGRLTCGHICSQKIWWDRLDNDILIDNESECYRKRGYCEGEKMFQGFVMLARDGDMQ